MHKDDKMTPIERLNAFMEAARKYGRYPVSPENWGL